MGLADTIKAQADKSSAKVFEQFKHTFEEMSQMISDTQDNQIEMNTIIKKIGKDINAIMEHLGLCPNEKE